MILGDLPMRPCNIMQHNFERQVTPTDESWYYVHGQMYPSFIAVITMKYDIRMLHACHDSEHSL